MAYRKDYIKGSLRDELGRLFILSFGVFLFILFFQPFPLKQLDFNNRLLFVTGFGAITFLVACSILVVLPLSIPRWFKISNWESGPPILLTLLLLVSTVTAFAFYIRYVGKAPLTLYIMFKVVLVCLLPLIILIILYKNKSLTYVVENLQEQNKYYISKIGEYENKSVEEEIDIFSNSKSDKLTLKYKNIILIKSADNYIEIFHQENDRVEKKLIRNTLKNVESQLVNQNNFIRCHRASIVNVMYIDKLTRSYSGYSLKMTCFEEKIPVSRQYLMQVREVISGIR
ncbi:MAG: LytTR family transcriptional regulator [Bacteroidales bacterium]|nr:MAG: LytTR family transcriptional regulator [Bacteroidales bacterium]